LGFILGFVLAAKDMKFTKCDCVSLVPSELTIDCKFTDSSMSVIVNFIKPVSKMLVRIETFRFYFNLLMNFLKQTKFEYLQNNNGKFRNIFKTDPFDWCVMVSGKSKLNPFVKISLNSFKASAPDFFKPCPWSGVVEVKNTTFQRQFVTFFPDGHFRMKPKFSNGVKDIIEIELDFVLS
jgi:hypothetical protein